MSDTDFTRVADAQKSLVAARKERLATTLGLGLLAMLALVVPALGIVEIGLGWNLMLDLFGPEVPGEAIPLNVYIMSLATCIGVVGFHILKHRYPDNIALKTLEALAPFAVLFFFIGMLGAYAVSDLGSGPSELELSFDDDTLFEDEPADEGGFLDTLKPIISLFTGLSLGALLVANLIVIHTVINYIRARLPDLLDRRQIALDIIETASSICNDTALESAVTREIKELDAQTPQDLALEVAADIESAAAPVMRSINKLKTRLALRKGRKGAIQIKRDKNLPHPLPDEATIGTFAADLEASLAALPDELQPIFE